MIYISLGIFLTILSFLEIFFRRTQNSQFSFAIVMVCLFVLSFLRFEVGTDWSSYLGMYNGNISTEKIEIGYRTLNNFFSGLGFPYFVFLAVISAISLGFIHLVVRRFKYKIIILFVYFSELFLYLNFSGMRQGIAIAVTLYSTLFIINKNFKVFVGLVLFASLFHTSALSFLLAYYIYHLEFTKKRLILLLTILIIAIATRHNIIEFLLTYIYNDKLFYYLTVYGVSENNTINFIIGIIKRSIILLIYFTCPKDVRNNYNLPSFIKVYVFGFIVYLLFYQISEDIATRVGSYYLIFDLLIISIFFQLPIHVYKKLLIFVMIIGMYMYKLYGYSQFTTYIYNTII